MKKTNAMRILDTAAINYSVRSYPVTTEQTSGVATAEILGISPETLFKTIVLHAGPKEYFVCCIPTDQALDLKKVAKACKVKKVELLPLKELEPLTGYIRGGCSPIGMKKKFPTFIDETLILFDTVAISSGSRGMMVLLNPEDLVTITQAMVVDIII